MKTTEPGSEAEAAPEPQRRRGTTGEKEEGRLRSAHIASSGQPSTAPRGPPGPVDSQEGKTEPTGDIQTSQCCGTGPLSLSQVSLLGITEEQTAGGGGRGLQCWIEGARVDIQASVSAHLQS